MNIKTNYLIKTRDKLTLEINNVLSKTLILLSSTILFSIIMSLLSIKLHTKPSILLFLLNFIILFLIDYSKNLYIKLSLVYIFTGLSGYILGPTINYILGIKNGSEILIFSLLITASSFFLLAFYTIITKKNFKYLHTFLLIGFIFIIGFVIANIFIKLTILNLMISGLIIIFSSAMILYTISNILNGIEQDYISATINLYLSIYNIFSSILHIFSNNE